MDRATVYNRVYSRGADVRDVHNICWRFLSFLDGENSRPCQKRGKF